MAVPVVASFGAASVVWRRIRCLAPHPLFGAASSFGAASVVWVQEYEGTVTIYPKWELQEMRRFLENFDEARVEDYLLDGERATWSHLPVIRSLCEVRGSTSP